MNNEIPSVELRIPAATYVRTLLFVIAAFLLWKLCPLLLLVYVALLVAAMFEPLVRYFARTRLGRGAGVFISSLVLLGALAAIVLLLMPALAEQVSALSKNLPKIREDILASTSGGSFHSALDKVFAMRPLQDTEKVLDHLMTVGEYALGGISSFLLTLIFAVYVLADGPRAFDWLTAFLSDADRAKAQRSSKEVSSIMFSYMIGQGITSLACAAYAYVVLSIFHVPGALMLAILAGVFDILPVLGFFCSGIPAVLLALSVSTSTAVWVLLLYVLYHALENYFIMPKVYGNRLRLSGLAVLAALLVGGLLGGVLGAVAVLPLVASYPALERIWLKPFLTAGTVERHDPASAKS